MDEHTKRATVALHVLSKSGRRLIPFTSSTGGQWVFLLPNWPPGDARSQQEIPIVNRISTARRRIELFDDAANTIPHPGLCFHWLKDFDTTTQIVIYSRVSKPDQEKNGNLTRREQHLRSSVEKLGYNIVDSVAIQILGYETEQKGLQRACKIADRVGGIVVTHSWDRFIRPDDWNGKLPPKANYNHPFHEWGRPRGTGITMALRDNNESNNDAPYKAMVGATKAAFAIAKEADSRKWKDGDNKVLFGAMTEPVVVFDGKLFKAKLNKDGKIEIEQVDESIVLFR